MMSLTRAFTLIAFGFFTRFVRAETPALCETDWCMNQVNRRVLEDYSLVDFGAGPHRRLDLGGITVLDFEGVGDNVAILDYYQSEGVIFSSNALAIVDRDVGGSGNFANEPSPGK